MKATFIYADRDQNGSIVNTEQFNTSHYRILIPAKYLKQAGHDIAVMSANQIDSSRIVSPVLVERELSQNELKILRAMGVQRVLYTFDDAYHLIPKDLVSYEYWKGKDRNLDELRRVCKAVDEVIVPSTLLAKDYKAKLIPNYHDPELWQPDETVRPHKNGELVIGWGGSNGHIETWRKGKFVDGLAKFLSSHKKARLVIYGIAASEILHSRGIEHESRKWMPFSRWPKEIMSFDIGLAPLTTKYDLRRSNLKLVEYGLAHVPFVATNVGEYRGAPGGILVEDDAREWLRALRVLADHKDRRMALAAKGLQWAERYLMSARVNEYEKLLWPEVY